MRPFLAPLLILLLCAGLERSALASHSGGMDAMSIDMDPFASPANVATSLGSLESDGRINQNGVQDADEDGVDSIVIDITATNIPAGSPMDG